MIRWIRWDVSPVSRNLDIEPITGISAANRYPFFAVCYSIIGGETLFLLYKPLNPQPSGVKCL